MKKSNRFLLIAGLFCALLLCCSSTAFSDQQVEIPYVISGDGWWTGIAITNETGTEINNMKLYFTTNMGASGVYVSVLKAAVPGPIQPNIPKKWVDYETDIPAIGSFAILANTLANFYKGDGNKALPSSTGSIMLTHTGSEKFSVTVYIGYDNGFGFQVFKSSAP